MAISEFFHPAPAFFILAAIIFFSPGGKGLNPWRFLLPIPPLLAVWAAFAQQPGDFAHLKWLNATLTFGRVDSLSLFFSQIFAFVSLAGMLYSMHLKDKPQLVSACVYVGSAFGCVFAGDYLTLFLFWEIMTIGSTLLVYLNRSRESALSALRYFIYHIIGGLLLLAGIMLRYHDVGDFSMIPPMYLAENGLALHDWLILAGFCVNAAVVPLHAWLSDAYPRASFGGIIFMCACTTKTALYCLARVYPGLDVLAVLGAVMAVYGVLFACIDNNARRILSYHIVSQVGYMVAGVGLGTAVTMNGAMAHAYADSMFKALLFMAVGGLLHSARTVKIDELGGLAARLPWLFIFYMIGAFSISGVPLFNGFVSKTMTISGAASAHATWIALALEVAAVGTVISVGLKLPYFAFFGGKPQGMRRELNPIPWNIYAAMAVPAVICIIQGVCPDILYRYLPFDMSAAPYVPWTKWHVLQMLMLIAFSSLAFIILRRVITPQAGLNLDLDYFYRLLGTLIYRCVSRPLAWLDKLWGEIYRVAGLGLMLLSARLCSAFDRTAIDGLVDGTARGVQNIGQTGAKLQNSDLQRYLALAVTLALLIFALIWWLH